MQPLLQLEVSDYKVWLCFLVSFRGFLRMSFWNSKSAWKKRKKYFFPFFPAFFMRRWGCVKEGILRPACFETKWWPITYNGSYRVDNISLCTLVEASLLTNRSLRIALFAGCHVLDQYLSFHAKNSQLLPFFTMLRQSVRPVSKSPLAHWAGDRPPDGVKCFIVSRRFIF